MGKISCDLLIYFYLILYFTNKLQRFYSICEKIDVEIGIYVLTIAMTHDHKLVLVLVYCLAHTVDLSFEREIRSDDICNNKMLIFISHINKDLPLIDVVFQFCTFHCLVVSERKLALLHTENRATNTTTCWCRHTGDLLLANSE